MGGRCVVLIGLVSIGGYLREIRPQAQIFKTVGYKMKSDS